MANHQEQLDQERIPGRTGRNGGQGSPTKLPFGILPQSFIQDREHGWVKRDSPVWMGCGDEGFVTPESAKEFRDRDPRVMSPDKGVLSLYGQVPGLIKITMVAGMAADGDKFYDDVGGFQGLYERYLHLAPDQKGPLAVRAALHSDRTKERAAFDVMRTMAAAADRTISKDATFCTHGMGLVGCAYCNKLGAAASLIGTDPNIQKILKAELAYATDGDTSLADPLIIANRSLARRLGKDFHFSRQSYANSGLPVMILGRKGGPNDEHLAASETGLIISYDATQVGNPKEIDAYRVEAAGVALHARTIFREYNIPRSLLMAAAIADATPVRAVLASGDVSGDKRPDPRRIALGIRGGTFKSALADIAQLEHGITPRGRRS